ncbi:MAG TPA: glycosyltransferase family 9 protein [Sedimentisphaerales bacterium]|nr:glycosyltransferase family 9 protein [Sedimentisphaerales bacterium]
MSEVYQNILLIKPSSLGDIVMALPALSSLRRSFPQARISWLVRPGFAPILEGHPHLDEIILFDRKTLGGAWRHPAAFGQLSDLITRLRRNRFDVVLDLQGLFRTASLAWLSGCKRRFGPVWRKEFARLFYTTTVVPQMEWVHVIDTYRKLIEAMGGRELSVEFVLPPKPIAVASAQKLLTQHKIVADRYAVIIPGSAQVSKCWPADRFAALADRLASEHGLSVVATGGKSESPMIEQIRGLSKHPIADLAGQTSLPELVEVLRQATLVVSNDTGPGHIAAALGRPLVMMFSWSNPLRVGPYGRPECIVGHDVQSRGLAIKSRNPQHSIRHIRFDEVYAKVVEQLATS